ncbi:MAG TPA: chromosome segregation SMC family protein [Patescibacteria group bacterium]|nr:chromosome segregation SMC family protein [Patescibacteria group bacterium]
MYLKSLEIQGFKSFALKTVLEFERGMTAIVGPNGSGKSNCADAVRWVLGEQSSKMVRGKKSEDVIFAGSDKKTRLGFAEVIATFDNSDRRIPVDTAEVSIGRRIDRTGNSEYLVSGNRVRLQDIVDLVLKSGIGTSRYTVIGQGTIDQMILSGPPEIKNLIDEASGVKTYYIKREKTLRKMEVTAENLMRAEDLIQEIEPRLRTLRRQAKRMEERAGLESELKALQLEYYSGLIAQHAHEEGKIHLQLTSVSARQNQAELELAGLQEHLEALEKEGENLALAGSEYQTQLFSLQEQKNNLTEKLSLVRGKMQSQRTGSTDSNSIRVDLHQTQSRIRELEEEASITSSKEKELRKAVDEKAAALAEVNRSLTELQKQMQKPESIDYAVIKKEIELLESSFKAFWGSMDASDDVFAIKQSASIFKGEFERFSEHSRRTLGLQTKSYEDLSNSLNSLLQAKDKFTIEYNNFKNELSSLSIRVGYIQNEITSLKKQEYSLQLGLKQATAVDEASLQELWQQLTAEEGAIQAEINELNTSIEAVVIESKKFTEADNARRASITAQDRLFRERMAQFNMLQEEASKIQIEKAKVDTRFESLTVEIEKELGAGMAQSLHAQPVPQVTANVAERIAKLKYRLDLIGGVDELTVQEFNETEARHTTLTTQVDDLKKSLEDLRQIMDELDQHIKVKFNSAFHKINAQFEYYFRMLFNGGRAYLTLVQEKSADDGSESGEEEMENENEEQVENLRPEEKLVKKYEKRAGITGVDIKATPPGKKLASVQALSGGERSLTAIALLCSLLSCFPSPFVFLDEVDAALDDANTIRFGQILGTLAHQTQFVTITHNRETMSRSSLLYGVTMSDDGVSKLLSVKLDQAKVYAK